MFNLKTEKNFPSEGQDTEKIADINPDIRQENEDPVVNINLSKVKEYSKEHHQETRQELVQEIAELRKSYIGRKKQLQSEIKKSGDTAEEKTERLNGATNAIQEMQLLLCSLEKSRLSALLNYKKIQRMIAEVEAAQQEKGILIQALKEAQAVKEELEKQLEDKEELKNARELLNDFYAEQKQKLSDQREEETKILANIEDLEKKESLLDAREIMAEHNVFFVHGLMSSKSISREFENVSPLQFDTTLEEKIKIVLALTPTISTSTIDSVESKQHIKHSGSKSMWSHMGILLNGGRVVSAYPGDAGSRPTGLNGRDIVSGDLKDSNANETAQKIEQAITTRNASGKSYNELNIENPEIAGIYYLVEDENGQIDYDKEEASQMADFAHKLSVPFYLMYNGSAYEAKKGIRKHLHENSIEKNQMTKARKRTVSDILNNEFHLDTRKKEKLIDEICINPPFQEKSIGNPEVHYARSRHNGMVKYMEFMSPKEIETSHGEMIEYKNDSRYFKRGEKVKFLDDIKGPNEVKRYLARGMELFCESTTIGRDGTEITKIEETGVTTNQNHLKFANLSKSRGIDASRYYGDGDLNDFCHSLEKEINSKTENTNNEAREDSIKNIAYYLHGFAQQAEKMGDNKVRDEATRIATEIISEDDFKDVISRRVGPNGELIISIDDLK